MASVAGATSCRNQLSKALSPVSGRGSDAVLDGPITPIFFGARRCHGFCKPSTHGRNAVAHATPHTASARRTPHPWSRGCAIRRSSAPIYFSAVSTKGTSRRLTSASMSVSSALGLVGFPLPYSQRPYPCGQRSCVARFGYRDRIGRRTFAETVSTPATSPLSILSSVRLPLRGQRLHIGQDWNNLFDGAYHCIAQPRESRIEPVKFTPGPLTIQGLILDPNPETSYLRRRHYKCNSPPLLGHPRLAAEACSYSDSYCLIISAAWMDPSAARFSELALSLSKRFLTTFAA